MGRKRTAKRPVAETKETPPPTSSPHDDSRFSLLDLPAEMRNEIYSYALTASEPLRVIPKPSSALTRSTALLPFEAEEERPLTAINLLRTCRQIHYEANPIFYGTNTFIARWEDALSPFTRTNFRHVQHFKLTVLHSQAWVSPL